MEVVEGLEQTFQHTHTVIAAITPEQYPDKTPCAEWTVQDLLDHTIDVVARLGALARGSQPTPFVLSDDPAAQFATVSAVALTAWKQPGVLDRMIEARPGTMPGRVLAAINLLDTATHAWDLAIATGQPAELPAGVATAALAASHEVVDDELRVGRFGPEQPVPNDASPTEQLVAFLGRSA